MARKMIKSRLDEKKELHMSGRILSGMVLIGLLVMSGCSCSVEEGRKSEEPVKPKAPETPQATVDVMIKAVENHDPVKVWDLLPESYQKDLNSGISQFAKSIDPELHKEVLSTVQQVLQILKEKKEFIVQCPDAILLLEKSRFISPNATKATVTAEIDAWMILLDTVVSSDLSDFEKLQRCDARPFLEKHGQLVIQTALKISKSNRNADLPTQEDVARVFNYCKKLQQAVKTGTVKDDLMTSELTVDFFPKKNEFPKGSKSKDKKDNRPNTPSGKQTSGNGKAKRKPGPPNSKTVKSPSPPGSQPKEPITKTRQPDRKGIPNQNIVRKLDDPRGRVKKNQIPHQATVMRRVQGFWVPFELAKGWPEIVREFEFELKGLAREWNSDKREILSGLTTFKSLLSKLDEAKSSAQFNSTVKKFISTQGGNARKAYARAQLGALRSAFLIYTLDNKGRFPTEAEGIRVLINPGNNKRPYIENLRNDPWGEPYVYRVSGTTVIVMTKGPDRREGTADDISVTISP
jgi:hypothetical protein